MIGLQRFAGVTIQLFRRMPYSSSSNTARATAVSTNQGINQEISNTEGNVGNAPIKRPRGRLIEAAFESLKEESNADVLKSTTSNDIDEQINNAKTVNGLLSIFDGNVNISRKHALKSVSILAEWSSTNSVRLSDFENDPRFLRICRVLGRTVPKDNKNSKSGETNGVNRSSGFRTDDLNTVLGVAGDDEAAKLIASISVVQMVKVMSTLAQRKRRSTPLLRSLAYNISSTTDHLDLKQCGDILYAMASLNFQDSVLAAKVCADIQIALPKNTEKSAVVGSILTSLGIQRYRDLDILEALTQWTLQHCEVCRSQDISALFHTSAVLNFKSIRIDEIREKLARSIVKEDFIKPVDWLNHVWSLALLGVADNAQLQSVLSTDFIKQLQETKEGLSSTTKIKLLNLNSYVRLMVSSYNAPLLPADSEVYNVTIMSSKSKQLLLNGLLDALKSLLPAGNYVNSGVDSKMGFLIDAVCLFDQKRTPISLDKESSNALKIALMVVDFHDTCHGTHRCASGLTNLSFDLLEKSGYKIIPVPYNEFNTSDKLLKRVQYLESKLKSAINVKT